MYPFNFFIDNVNPALAFSALKNFEFKSEGGKPFSWNPQDHVGRSILSLHWALDPIRNTDPRIDYSKAPTWEWKLTGDRGHFPMYKYCNAARPSVSQYRALMPPKSPFENFFASFFGASGLAFYWI